jgi:hypothetical protein
MCRKSICEDEIMKMKIALAAIAAACFLPAVSQAVELDYVGAKVSTLGLGAEVGFEVNDFITVRGLVHNFNYGYDDTLDGIKYDGDLKLSSFGVQGDLKVFPGIYLTAGMYSNKNKIDLSGTPTGNTQIGDLTFTPTQIGTLTSHARFKSSVPYLGLGFRQGFGPIELNFEAGAYMQGKAKVTLTSNGTLASDPTYKAELEKERARQEDELGDFKTYPAVSLGLRYKF